MTEAKQRSAYWDNIKGALILLVVFAHILYQLQNTSQTINSIVDYIYMFHMPAFVFVSGYFGKSERSRSPFAIIRLLFLYFIFNSIMGFIFGFGSLLEPLYSFWYLPALVIWRLTAHHIAKFREINLILLVVSLLIGFFPSVNNTFAAARIIAFYPYYMFGYKLSAEKSEALSSEKYTNRLLKGIAVIIIAAAAAFFAYSFFRYSDNALLMYGYDNAYGAFGRIALYIIAFLAIYGIRCISPDKNIPFLTLIGRNSLWIFLLHRPFTIWLSDLIKAQGEAVIIISAVIAALLLCFVFGNNLAAKYLDRFADSGAAIFTDKNAKKFSFAKLALLLVALGFVFSVVARSYADFFTSPPEAESPSENQADDIIYPVMTAEQQSSFDNAFRITFAGDLILLEDQVKRGYTENGYDFSPVFQYAEKYISSADLAIGVFEGPMAGEEAGYTTSNFDDGKELYLNFPDEFASAVKNAGFDLVTTANNHLLDKGEAGALRTLDILDKAGLDHTGSYRSEAEKQQSRVKLIEKDGIRMAFLSYTYGCNYYDTKELADGELSYLTSFISDFEAGGTLFERLKASVQQDFEEAKKLSPDLIIVLPHIGTQFSNQPNEEQDVWFKIFKDCGADIILGDHSHSVQPITIEEYGGKRVFTAYCPGNFANIYRENQGDISMLTEIYIDKTTKQIIGGGIVPLYTQSAINGNFRAIPTFDIMNDDALRNTLSTDDLDRANSANKTVTKVVFGSEMDISSVTERYYFNENGFLRTKTTGLELTDKMKESPLYRSMEKAQTVCFIGDSLTEGTKNGGCPWYEPIEGFFPDKTIYNFSKGGCTISYINENVASIPKADLYVIAIGTNDVRYRDESACAMTSGDYIVQMTALKTALQQSSPNAGFIFIAPWYSEDGDPFCPLSYGEKTALNDEYSAALKDYCDKENIFFIDPNPYLKKAFSTALSSLYLLDHIHPNSTKGVLLYSQAVLLS